MGRHIARHQSARPIGARINLAAQQSGDQRRKGRYIARRKCQVGCATQFLRAPPVRGQQRNMSAMHFQRHLRHVIFPERWHDPAIDLRQNRIQIAARITIMPVQPRKARAQRSDARHMRPGPGPRGKRQMQPGSVILRQFLQRVEQEIKPLVTAHIAQIGQPQRAVRRRPRRQGTRARPGPICGMFRSDPAGLHGMQAEAQRQRPCAPRNRQHPVAMRIDQGNHLLAARAKPRRCMPVARCRHRRAMSQAFHNLPAALHQRLPNPAENPRARPHAEAGEQGFHPVDAP